MKYLIMFLIVFLILNEINLINSKFTAAYVPVKCEDGYYYKGPVRICSICEAGKYCQNNLMYNCRKGTYSPEGSSGCVLCPRGTYLNKEAHPHVINFLLGIAHFLAGKNVTNAIKEHIHQIWDLYA